MGTRELHHPCFTSSCLRYQPAAVVSQVGGPTSSDHTRQLHATGIRQHLPANLSVCLPNLHHKFGVWGENWQANFCR